MATLNYFIEANAGLIFILACYYVFLRRETNFRLLRFFLLGGIVASLVFPLIHIETAEAGSPLSIGHMIPSYWLPEVVVGAETTQAAADKTVSFWQYAEYIYLLLLSVVCLAVFYQLVSLFRMIRKAQTYREKDLYIAETNEDKPTFSFFNFILIGKAQSLSPEEKQQIILHESVHAHQWHSFDILLISALRIVFWFNPLLAYYKKTFVQLHEFEADARAAEHSDVDKYCSLLARVALSSADFRLANHFNNSLTIKRIEMMRTIKTNIRRWKLVALSLTLPLVFAFVACQDQVGDDVMEITKNSSHALIIPEHVQARYEQLKKEYPDKEFAVLELNETASEKLQNLQEQYGLPSMMEVFKTRYGKAIGQPIKGEANRIVIREDGGDKAPSENGTLGHNVQEIRGRVKKGEQTFAILEFTDEASRISDQAAGEDKIYTVVQEQPEYNGGYEAMMSYIRSNLLYPAQDRQQGIEGTVYVSFIVHEDGRVSDAKVIRGISLASDNEAKRVVESFPNWKPGKQNGAPVKVKFVLPIKFAL